MTTKKVFKIFWAWQDSNEEVWLNQMAKEGWALRSYKYLYTFDKAEPDNYIYKLDYKANKDDDLDEYKMIFQDAGWEYVTRYGDWHYFRTLATEDTSPEIYTECEYKIEKYNSLLSNLTAALIALIVFAIIGLTTYQSPLLFGIFLSLLSIISVCIFKVKQKINRLRE
ncbi:DUF2812 domain-containing protein [Cytobacillus sp. FJAT-54145]|uniref:DUF2812 domain-containing protein n=1 Tax=Cytobacillus spartinae TaxID=3299023 RepID=A0ABW6KBZ8_9BACI